MHGGLLPNRRRLGIPYRACGLRLWRSAGADPEDTSTSSSGPGGGGSHGCPHGLAGLCEGSEWAKLAIPGLNLVRRSGVSARAENDHHQLLHLLLLALEH